MSVHIVILVFLFTLKVRTYFGSCPLKSDCKNPSLYEVSGSKNDDGNLKKNIFTKT